ncbi:unnamed protein product [Eruca vesicaria subsp. sativa]|uniref:Uncharacterized protein n=1 Tax=Eruca vesicaria subsp. sativa TaxID=29727 RepID=A0ABC8LYS4_ERUVS|nr:unnamed protein product [Eruca vesicaria subsp. sativa]
MRGRLWEVWIMQSVAGLLCVLLGRVNSLWTSIVVMWIFSIFVQAASGLIFGIVVRSDGGNDAKWWNCRCGGDTAFVVFRQ